MRPYETQMPKIQMAGRDDTRAKGAKKHEETNYERYFGTPEKAAETIVGLNLDDCVYCTNKPECDDYESITAEKCEKCARQWLMRPAEE